MKDEFSVLCRWSQAEPRDMAEGKRCNDSSPLLPSQADPYGCGPGAEGVGILTQYIFLTLNIP